MASYSTRPNGILIDLDPYEQLTRVLENPLFKPHISIIKEIPDLLTSDIEQQLEEQGKSAWSSEKVWLSGLKTKANKIMNRLNMDTEKYEFLAGHESWVQDIFAAPVKLRIKKSDLPIQPTISCIYASWEEAIKYLYECAEKGTAVKPEEGSEANKVMVLMNSLEEGYHCDHIQLMAHCSMADVRFAKLLTILRIWKEREFDKIDIKGAFSLYAFALMLIHFLQVGCQPPVLPRLKDLGIAMPTYAKYTVCDCVINFKSENEKSLGNLLFNFFNYYETTMSGGFDFVNWKISVRDGRVVKLDEPSKSFFIEDPLQFKPMNAVDESKSPGISNVLAVMFMQCRARLMRERRLHQLENFI